MKKHLLYRTTVELAYEHHDVNKKDVPNISNREVVPLGQYQAIVKDIVKNQYIGIDFLPSDPLLIAE